ncbi:MAG TPA: DUF2934 domain-containing protein [Tepidisphaeraceae bacterium]|nr:DUF2934 domain-containing protein [Tepidisphaeraceae bacterium]
MQKKKPASKSTPATKPAAKPAASTVIRNTAVPPKIAPAAKKEIGWDQIARRAYFIWQSRGGSEMDNWLQAERELRGS